MKRHWCLGSLCAGPGVPGDGERFCIPFLNQQPIVFTCFDGSPRVGVILFSDFGSSVRFVTKSDTAFSDQPFFDSDCSDRFWGFCCRIRFTPFPFSGLSNGCGSSRVCRLVLQSNLFHLVTSPYRYLLLDRRATSQPERFTGSRGVSSPVCERHARKLVQRQGEFVEPLHLFGVNGFGFKIWNPGSQAQKRGGGKYNPK
jgi:hypothetical protein